MKAIGTVLCFILVSLCGALGLIRASLEMLEQEDLRSVDAGGHAVVDRHPADIRQRTSLTIGELIVEDDGAGACGLAESGELVRLPGSEDRSRGEHALCAARLVAARDASSLHHAPDNLGAGIGETPREVVERE